MREIISLQVGQCGNQIGYKFWETIAQEHGLDTVTGKQTAFVSNKQLERTHVFFQEIENYTSFRFVPRAILIDLEPGVLDSIRASSQMG